MFIPFHFPCLLGALLFVQLPDGISYPSGRSIRDVNAHSEDPYPSWMSISWMDSRSHLDLISQTDLVSQMEIDLGHHISDGGCTILGGRAFMNIYNVFLFVFDVRRLFSL